MDASPLVAGCWLLCPYAFANGNPATFRDPTGLFTVGQVTMAASISISLSSTAISKWGDLVKGEINAQQYGMMLGAAAFSGGIGALGGGVSLASIVARGALAGGFSAGIQNFAEQVIDARKGVDYFSMTISTLGGTSIGGFGSLLAKSFAASGFMVDHSAGLFPFGSQASQEIRMWTEVLYSPAERPFEKRLAALTELLESVMQEVVDGAHEPHAGSK